MPWRISPFVSVLVVLLVIAVSGVDVARAQMARWVDSVAITVSYMDRALAFYTDVLLFKVVSEIEVAGEDYARLFGVFGLRARIVRLRLGRETPQAH